MMATWIAGGWEMEEGSVPTIYRSCIPSAVGLQVAGTDTFSFSKQAVSRLRTMGAITSLFLLVTCQFCFAGGDASIIAMSDWSKPVGTEGGHSLRVRMIVAYGRGAGFAGPWPETQVCMEFHNVSGAITSPTQFYFHPSEGLRCEMKDANGKTVSTGGAGSGGGAGASWITLPYDSTIRLRANMYGYGSKPGDGLNLTIYPPQAW
jgi:hypothetical protein